MWDDGVLKATADCLVELADGGAALEFAIGTGRVALPLAARGVPVTGIELSADMLAVLRSKPEATGIRAVEGDMAVAFAEGDFSLVYLVFNTITNLTSQDEQVACFENAARHLRPGGRFVIETYVPALRQLPPGRWDTVSLYCGHGSSTTPSWMNRPSLSAPIHSRTTLSPSKCMMVTTHSSTDCPVGGRPA
jgi:SAM-dependent methyltransferase